MHNKLQPQINRNDLFAPFQQAFDQIYDEVFSDSLFDSARKKAGYPRLDVYTAKEQGNTVWVVEAALPGVGKEDLQVEILPAPESDPRADRRTLKISGKMSECHQVDGKHFVRELRRSAFERYLTIPADVRGDPQARMKDGILKLTWVLDSIPEKRPKLIPVVHEE